MLCYNKSTKIHNYAGQDLLKESLWMLRAAAETRGGAARRRSLGHEELKAAGIKPRTAVVAFRGSDTAQMQRFKPCQLFEFSWWARWAGVRGRDISDGVVVLRGGAEGGAPQGLQAVDEEERAGQVLPALGDGVLHLVDAHVQLLDHVSVAVADLSGPRDQEVIRRLPHGLQTGEKENTHPVICWRTPAPIESDFRRMSAVLSVPGTRLKS